MNYNKTQNAIIHVLQDQGDAMCAEDIFIRLNPGKKCYSYASVYHNIRLLCTSGILSSQTQHPGRKRLVWIKKN